MQPDLTTHSEPGPPMLFTHGVLTATPFVVLIVGTVLGLCIVKFYRRRQEVRFGSKSGLIAAVAMGLGFALFGVKLATSPQQVQIVSHSSTVLQVAESPRTIGIARNAESDPSRSTVSTVDSLTDISKLPEWTQAEALRDDSLELIVVRSGRFATKEEAEEHAFDEAAKLVAQRLRHLDPTGVAAPTPTQREIVRESAIKQRFEETSLHNFGALKDHPMHQVWLQLELSAQLGEKFAEPWRRTAVDARLRTLATWAGWATTAAALATIALRIDPARLGKNRDDRI